MGSTGHTFRLSFTVGDGEAEAQGLPEPQTWTARDLLRAARLGIVEDLVMTNPVGECERYALFRREAERYEVSEEDLAALDRVNLALRAAAGKGGRKT